MHVRHDGADPWFPLFEINLIAMACGLWEWQVCRNEEPIICGYAATREMARFGGHTDLFTLLSLGRMV
jgi:hypothetical protein